MPEKIKGKETTQERVIGIDLGIKTFATLSNGEKIDNPKFLEKSSKKLACHQRRLSKKVKGSKRYNKQRIKVAKIYRDIHNKTQNFLHKITKELIENYDFIMIEDLDLQQMMNKKGSFGKSLSSVSGGEFRRQIEYKSDLYGKNVIVVPAYNTSKTCSSCGNVNEDLKLSDREWICQCGKHHDRDINAAINIKKAGFKKENIQRYWNQYHYVYENIINTPRLNGEEYVESSTIVETNKSRLIKAEKRKDGILLFR
jgi:putative transposase